jgi:RNAse (barnase) inhibitor barstar
MLHPKALSVVTWACVHFVDAEEAVHAFAEPAGDRIVRLAIDGRTLQSDQDVFSAVAKAFAFPDYFGRNWDAFDECLRDLAWLPAGGYVLVVEHASSLWERAPKSAGKLIDSWLFVAEDWAQNGISFHLVFVW